MDNCKSISVVMPALNEEKSVSDAIRAVLNAFTKFELDGEIIVVDDGSRDRTAECVEKACYSDSRVKLLRHPVNMGIGRSFMDGVKAAKKEAVVMIPGDNENDPCEIFKFLYLIKDVDIIVPFIHNSEVRDRFRRIISSLYRLIINISYGINLNYTNGTVVYRRRIIDDVSISSPGFFYQAELLIKLVRKNYLYAEVPNFLSKRSFGKSKAVTFKSLLNVAKSYLRLAYQIHVQRIEAGPRYKHLSESSVTHLRYEDAFR